MQKKLQQLYQQALVWDAHAGVFPSPEVDLNLLDEWPQSGASYLSINVGFDVMNWQETMATLAAYRHWLLTRSDRFVLVSNTRDIDRARGENKFALSFDIEGMNALNDDINMVGLYHALGVRQMLFAYNLNNTAAGGCHDQDTGLTEFGRQVVSEMNRVGMIVDCSHAAYSTTMDIIGESSQPVVFSHSNPAAVWDHQRNIRDDQIKACAAGGGVIGLNGMGIFLGDNDISIDTMLRHVRYVGDLVGNEHIGFGFDYSPKVDVDIGVILRSRPDYWPAGQQYDTRDIKHASPQQLPQLIDALGDSGFDEAAIRGFLGENFRRVANHAWHG
ncbi:MAG: membrane dipeptidase [Gammaproteobacteria bacterium]|nr:membrane dipeptidase [Gammaproteobacteria bacterium]